MEFTPTKTQKLHSLKVLDYLIKVLLVMAFGWVIYRQRIEGQDLDILYIHFRKQLDSRDLYWLFLTVILMPFNWWFESLKWQCFTRSFSVLNSWQHFRAVLAGITFSLFTPNRLGDYLGRIIATGRSDKGKVFTATLAAHYVQLIVVLGFGWLGALLFLPRIVELPTNQMKWVAGVGISGTLFLGLMGFILPKLLSFVKRLAWIQRLKWIEHSLNVLHTYQPRHFIRAAAFASVRYGIYCTQYYCMLRLTGIDLNYGIAWCGIALIFLIQTSIPLPPVLGLLARGEIAIFVWGEFDANEWSILTASYGLFLINLLVPGILGLITVIQLNLIKPKEDGK